MLKNYYDMVLIERRAEYGLTKQEIIDAMDMLNATDYYPLAIARGGPGYDNHLIGFIAPVALFEMMLDSGRSHIDILEDIIEIAYSDKYDEDVADFLYMDNYMIYIRKETNEDD